MPFENGTSGASRLEDPPVLKAEGLQLADEAGLVFAGPLDLAVRPGETVLVVVRDLGVLRRLMRCCLAFEQPDSGRLTWWPGADPGPADPSGWSGCAFFRRVGYVDRQSQLLHRWSLLDHFRFHQLYAGLSGGLNSGLELLKTLGLANQAETLTENLPEPLRRLGLYALVFFQRPRLVLLERPFQFLDRDFGLVWGLIKSRAAARELAVVVFDRGQDCYPPDAFGRKIILAERERADALPFPARTAELS